MYSTVFKHILTCVSCIRFHYTRYDKKFGPIHKSIEALDKMGMDIIETGNADAFKQISVGVWQHYLWKTSY
jgi:uncharacterized lipoprotein NlpE involved in copper resistance